MFRKKPKVKIDAKRREVTIIEELPVENLYDMIQDACNAQGLDTVATLTVVGGELQLLLEDNWTYSKKTVSIYNQKVNKRFRKINRATGKLIVSKFKRL